MPLSLADVASVVWPVKWNLDVYLSSEGLNAGGHDILIGECGKRVK